MTPKSGKLAATSSTDLVKLFAEAAAVSGRALEDANPRLANKHADIKRNIYRELQSRGTEAQKLILSLLTHADPFVRCAVAVRALEFAPQVAEPILSSLADLRGPVAVTLI
jgi:Domain of unknown function (DUF2019)